MFAFGAETVVQGTVAVQLRNEWNLDRHRLIPHLHHHYAEHTDGAASLIELDDRQ